MARLLIDNGATPKTTGTITELHALSNTQKGPFPPVRVMVTDRHVHRQYSHHVACARAAAGVIGCEVGQRYARLGQAFALHQAVANAHGRWRKSRHVHDHRLLRCD
jgi:hypothetical protein